MEETREMEASTGYVPRPKWQVWGARVGAVLFACFIVYQILCIAGGGL